MIFYVFFCFGDTKSSSKSFNHGTKNMVGVAFGIPLNIDFLRIFVYITRLNLRKYKVSPNHRIYVYTNILPSFTLISSGMFKTGPIKILTLNTTLFYISKNAFLFMPTTKPHKHDLIYENPLLVGDVTVSENVAFKQ